MGDGFCLWDLNFGTDLKFVPVPGCDNAMFEPSGALVTNGAAGLLQWPIDKDGVDTWQVGSPQQLPVAGPICHIARSGDGQLIAVSQFDGAQIFHANAPADSVTLGPHKDARYISVSSNGKWAATGSHNGTQVKLWNAAGGDPFKELPIDGAQVEFSPDGRWLGTNAPGVCLWSTDSWEVKHKISGNCLAFSPNSQMVAVESGYGVVKLINPESGREYAQLEDPFQDRARMMRFTTDSAQLVAINDDSQSIHVWDLRRIRGQLSAMGLDWDMPEYTPAAMDRIKPFQIRIKPGASTLKMQPIQTPMAK